MKRFFISFIKSIFPFIIFFYFAIPSYVLKGFPKINEFIKLLPQFEFYLVIVSVVAITILFFKELEGRKRVVYSFLEIFLAFLVCISVAREVFSVIINNPVFYIYLFSAAFRFYTIVEKDRYRVGAVLTAGLFNLYYLHLLLFKFPAETDNQNLINFYLTLYFFTSGALEVLICNAFNLVAKKNKRATFWKSTEYKEIVLRAELIRNSKFKIFELICAFLAVYFVYLKN